MSTVLFFWASTFTLVGFAIGFTLGSSLDAPKPKRNERGRFCK